MSTATTPLARRIHGAILDAYDHDALAEALYLDFEARLDTLVTDKSFRAQVFELLAVLDRQGRVPALLRCLCAGRDGGGELAALWAEAEARQAQVGAGRPILGGTGSDARPVPLQKPLRTQHFTGRGAELARLLDELQPGKVATLCGPGGMGKSALAAEAIWTLAPGDEPPARFPDGIIFHTFYHQPQASLALEKIARAYGIDPRPTPRDAALQALGGKTALLVLDGAEQADDLPAVLAVAGNCSVLVTTRRHADAAEEVQDVEPLPRAESLALLRAWSGRYAAGDDAAHDIVQLLGGLPLALYLCGRYLAQRHQQAGEYVAWLKEEGLEALHFGARPTTSIPLLLRRSLEQVSAQAQAAYGVAGLLAPAPFGAEAAAAALGIKTGAANRALGELVDYGLLLRPDDSYQVTHALAHSYARTEAAPNAGVVDRLALYFAALAEAESAKGPTGYAALDKQRDHIVAVQAAALKAEQWDAVRRLAWNVRDYLDLQGYWTDRITVAQAGLAAALAGGNRYDEGAFLTILGNTYFALGETRRAVEYHEQYLSIARELGDRRGEGNALGSLGLAYAALGETRRAIDLYEQRLAIARELSGRRGEGIALGSLGLAYAALGETRRAIDLYEQQLVIGREIGDRHGEGIALSNLGLAYKNLGETHRAIELYEQRLVIAREIGDRRGEGIALSNLGAAYSALGETHRAIELFEQRLGIAREIGDRRGEGAALGNLADLLAALGHRHAAAEAFAAAIALAKTDGYRYGEGVRRTNYSSLLALSGDLSQARREAAAAAAIAAETGNAQVGSEANTMLALIALLAEDYPLAGTALAAAGQFAYPPNAVEPHALGGVLALRHGGPDAAVANFAAAIAAANARLENGPDLYSALDQRAIARCGLALSRPQAAGAGALLQAAAADLRAARAANSDPGTLAQLRLRFSLLAPHDPAGQLAEVLAILDAAGAQTS